MPVAHPRRLPRLAAEPLRQLAHRVHRATRIRVRTIDGRRRFQALTDARAKVVQHIIREVGWRGRERLYVAQIAGEVGTSEDTVLNALADAEAWGWIRRHAEYRTAPDGTRQRDASTFELLSGETQGAAGSCTNESIISFWRRRRARAERERERRASGEVVWLTVSATDPPPDPDKARAVAAKCGW
jgi:hypothetical protein